MATEGTDELDGEEPRAAEVTKSHYVPQSERQNCKSQSCNASFVRPSLKRPHHCRRCGEVFCASCLLYKRRLNKMAQPDPDGVFCKVCLTCFEDRGPTPGCTKRSRTELFRQLRNQNKEKINGILQDPRKFSEQHTLWREQFTINIPKECQRLLQGFKTSASGLGTLDTLYKFKGQLGIPKWQKPAFWKVERLVSACRYCDRKIENKKKLRNCRVCGLALCKKCSLKELLLYFEDGTRRMKAADARLSIIRFTGCPDKEPQCSMLLYCCKECKGEIIRRQLDNSSWYLENMKLPGIVSEIVRMDDKIRSLVEDINGNIEKIREYDSTSESATFDFTYVYYENPNGDPKEQKVTMKENELETLKGKVHDGLQAFRNVYWYLRSIIEQDMDSLPHRTHTFVMNYVSARNKFYVETKRLLAH